MRRIFGLALGLAIVAAAATPGTAQTLYSLAHVDSGADVLKSVDPDTGEPTAVIGSADVSDNKGLAMNPSNGLLYAAEGDAHMDPWQLITIQPGDGSESILGDTGTDEKVRDLVFDAAGTLWAVTGAQSGNPDALLTLNTTTGAPAVQNSSLPTDKNRIAYRRGWNDLWLLGREGTDGARLFRISPSDPSTLTEVALSGDDLGSFSPFIGFVYDPYADRFLVSNDLDWFALTPGGVVTQLSPFVTDNTFGLAFDAVTTAFTRYVFVDGFEVDGVCVWSDALGDPGC